MLTLFWSRRSLMTIIVACIGIISSVSLIGYKVSAQNSDVFGSTNCSNTDGGKNYYVKGDFSYDTTRNDKINGHAGGTESCYGDIVNENYCDENGVSKTEKYKCPKGCKDGACIGLPPVEEPKFECTDSDGGKDYFVKGIAKNDPDQSAENTDVCMPVSVANPDGHALLERSCDNNKINSEYYYCENGCVDGACLKEPASLECEGSDCPDEPKIKKTFTVYAGVEVYYKNSSFEVTGEASDLSTKLSDPMIMKWSQVSGPAGGKVVFSRPECLKPNFVAYCKTNISATKDGVYKIRLKVTNPQKVSSYDDFALVWDTTAPVLKEVKRISEIGNDLSPTIVFSASFVNAVKPVYNRFGDISYGGACVGHGTSAKEGNNEIELVALADGTYDDCTIQVTDIAGNTSKALKISKFTIDTHQPTPPAIEEPENNVFDSSYIISGTKDAGTSVRLKNKEIVKHTIDTKWKYKVKLNSGENSFDIFTEDLAGNNSEKVVFKVTKEKPICVAWAYGSWGKCDNNKQTRKILSATPKNCAGGKPAVIKDCQAEPNKPACKSYDYSAWSKCVKNLQSRTVESVSPNNCQGGEKPILSQKCGSDLDDSCEFINYTSWSNCDNKIGKKRREIESTSPRGCLPRNLELEKDCNACESYNYSVWSACVDNKQTRTVESTLPADCSGGIKPVLSQECGKNSCEFVYYTTWSACDKATGKRTRQIESTSPKACVPKNPELSKDCNACESYNYSMWSACVNNKQTRVIESTFPSDCSGGVGPIVSRECGKDACDFVYYTTWSACNKTTGQRTRQVESTSPAVCVVDKPWLTKDCNACESYNYSMWSACVGNVQSRTVESTFPSDCSGGAQSIVSRECGKDYCDFVYYTTWSKCDKNTGQRTRQVESTSPAVCIVENPWLSKDCDPCESYNYSAWSTCDASGIQHRTQESTFPEDCYTGASPVFTRSCVPCDSWIYSTWSACVNGQQTRTIQPGTSMPLNCWGGSPLLSRSCG